MSETIPELERILEFILQELQKLEEIECPSLKQVSRNLLLTSFRRTLSLIFDVKRNETENTQIKNKYKYYLTPPPSFVLTPSGIDPSKVRG